MASKMSLGWHRLIPRPSNSAALAASFLTTSASPRRPRLVVAPARGDPFTATRRRQPMSACASRVPPPGHRRTAKTIAAADRRVACLRPRPMLAITLTIAQSRGSRDQLQARGGTRAAGRTSHGDSCRARRDFGRPALSSFAPTRVPHRCRNPGTAGPWLRSLIAVGTALAGGPPHRSQRAELPHWAPALGRGSKAHLRIRVQDAGWRQPSRDEAVHPLPRQPVPLAAAPQRP